MYQKTNIKKLKEICHFLLIFINIHEALLLDISGRCIALHTMNSQINNSMRQYAEEIV